MKPLKTISQSSNSPIAFYNDKSPHEQSQVVSPLVKRTIAEESELRVYPHCVCYIVKKLPKPSKKRHISKRSTIKTFSKRSRFRLFVAMAQIKSHLVNKPFFITLTYHHGHELREASDKTVLHNFLVSMRDFDQGVQFIWRIDLQKRGAPHYHLILFPSINKKIPNRKKYMINVCNIWHRVADPNSRRHKDFGCDVQNISNYRHACSYINKYLAKLPDGETGLDKGKHWGCSRNLPNKPFDVYKLNEITSPRIIEKLRKWLLKNGRNDYADDYYFNQHRSQIVFIDAREFYTIMGYTIASMDFYGL
jgi:hypothetical protein